jgi:hypothetical protein
LLDEFELELLDHGSELVLVEVLLEVFVLVFPACALVVNRTRDAAARASVTLR